MTPIVKVCGITNLQDARLSVEWGANALGFNFYPPSPRYVHPRCAAEIIDELPETVLAVGIFVQRLRQRAEKLVQVVQIHGLKQAAEIPPTDRTIWVAVSPERAAAFPQHQILIDTSWGRGRLADWDALEGLQRPYILSGGLTPDNVGLALQRLHPAGIDVCSGVESSPGTKDAARLRAFLSEVRRHWPAPTRPAGP